MNNDPVKLKAGERSITTTPFQLLQWKHALKLELVGMKLSRGQQVSTYLRRRLELKRSFSKNQLIELIETKLAEIQA
jgi:hypothetical protein